MAEYFFSYLTAYGLKDEAEAAEIAKGHGLGGDCDIDWGTDAADVAWIRLTLHQGRYGLGDPEFRWLKELIEDRDLSAVAYSDSYEGEPGSTYKRVPGLGWVERPYLVEQLLHIDLSAFDLPQLAKDEVRLLAGKLRGLISHPETWPRTDAV